MNNISNNQNLYALLRRLWHHIDPRRRVQIGILFLLMIVASFAEVVSIGAVLPFLGVLTAPDRVFGHALAQPLIQALSLTEPKQLLLPLTIAFAIAAIFAGTVRFVLLWAQNRFSYGLGADLAINVYRRTLYQPYAVHVARNSSEVVAGIGSKVDNVVGNAIMPILSILNSGLMSFTILVALIGIEPMVAVSVFGGFAIIYMLLSLVTQKRLLQYGQIISYRSNQVIKDLQEGLGGIRDVLIAGAQQIYCRALQNTIVPLRRAQSNVQIISSGPRFVIEAVGMILIATISYFLAERAEGIMTAIPMMGAFALGAQRLIPALQQAYVSWSAMRSGQAALGDVLNLLDQPLPEHANEPLPAQIPFQHHISLNNLSFRYASEAPWVLQGLDLTIPKGSRIGFIGSTGSGKSTLLDIIMGLLQPTEGSLAIDGVPITAQNCRAWQAQIAHVSQAIFLADTTIAENIAFGVPINEIDYDRVRQAAQKSQISQTIEAWSKKYNTSVGERGIRLSGGQRQRIGIARALYKRANVIVFDEATSALDSDTERAVMEAIESLGDELTILIVAHRLTTLKNCMQVIELEKGEVQRVGSYETVCAR